MTLTLAPGETRTARDVLLSLFGVSGSDYGPILIRSSQVELVALGQTWTPGGGGTYGQSVPAMGPADFVGTTPRSMAGIRQGSDYRTNLVLGNASEQSAEVLVRLVAANGTILGEQTIPLAPLGFKQVDRVVEALGGTTIEDGAVVVSSRAGEGKIGAYAVVIDSRSGDPRTILAR